MPGLPLGLEIPLEYCIDLWEHICIPHLLSLSRTLWQLDVKKTLILKEIMFKIPCGAGC